MANGVSRLAKVDKGGVIMHSLQHGSRMHIWIIGTENYPTATQWRVVFQTATFYNFGI